MAFRGRIPLCFGKVCGSFGLQPAADRSGKQISPVLALKNMGTGIIIKRYLKRRRSFAVSEEDNPFLEESW